MNQCVPHSKQTDDGISSYTMFKGEPSLASSMSEHHHRPDGAYPNDRRRSYLKPIVVLLWLGALVHSRASVVPPRRLLEDGRFDDLLHTRSRLQSVLQHRSATSARGIVIPAGGPVLLRNAAALVGLIRGHFECDIPIEVSYNGKEEMFPPAMTMLNVGLCLCQHQDRDRIFAASCII